MDPTTRALAHHLDGRYGDVRTRVRQLLEDPLFAPTTGLPRDEHRARVAEQMAVLGERKLTPALGYPTAVGGQDDLGAGIAAFETLAFGSLSLLIKAGVQWGLFGGAILNLGTERHHERYLADVADLTLPGCFAMTEVGHGSDVQSLRTTATYDPADGTFVVHTPDEDAAKDYIGNAGRDGRAAVVFAQLITPDGEHGVHALVVPIRDDDMRPCPGVTLADDGPKAGLNGVDNGRITFDHVRVPREDLLDRFGAVEADGRYTSPIENPSRRFFTMLGTLVTGRTSIAGAAISATKVALAIAIRYGEVRRQFDADGDGREQALLDYQSHQTALLPALAKTYALHFAQEDLVDRLVKAFAGDDADARREVEPVAAGLKAVATWHAVRTIQACREACGGAGYLSVNRLPDLRADTDVFATFEGANTVLLQLVAKGLLTGYREEFSQLDTLGTARFAADQVVDTLLERLRGASLVQSLRSVMPSAKDDPGLRDRGWQVEMFTYREEHALETAAMRIRAGMEDHGDSFRAFNDVQNHVLYAARVHIENLVLQQMTAAVDRCADPDARAQLELLNDLYALSTIEEDRAWFLEHGRISPEQSKAITAEVEQLLAEVRPHARGLVDAFGIPEEAIAAPIALGDEARRQELRRQAQSGA
ncbi:acyl-CoA dehydrogenase [Euzebya sp.]|uniref:acyl-CoA dehydrogenase family protein n=1 Tax=Euzebya sp. TaxID=1971409 RepID=UPI0035114401